jgi:hypothetical protein
MIGSKFFPILPAPTRREYGRRVGPVSLRHVVCYSIECYWPLYMTRLPVSATVVPLTEGRDKALYANDDNMGSPFHPSAFHFLDT